MLTKLSWLGQREEVPSLQHRDCDDDNRNPELTSSHGRTRICEDMYVWIKLNEFLEFNFNTSFYDDKLGHNSGWCQRIIKEWIKDKDTVAN